MFSESLKIKSISDVLSSIDVSLQLIANTKTQTTSAFVTRKTIAQRLGVPTISIDKLILKELDLKPGLIEGKHTAS